jgi:pimeloyl-ACP methyl ester carboxylesterase
VGPLVAAGCRVITFNPRGVPPSDVPEPPYSIEEMAADARGLIDEVAETPVVAVGYSMGALVIQELVLRRPEMCRGAALLGTLARKDNFRRALFAASLEALRAGHEMPADLQLVTRAMQLFGPARLDDDRWARKYLKHASAATAPDPDTRRGLLGQQAATTDYDNRLDALREIRTRTLVVGFELDVLVPAKLSREVADAIPGARYVEIEGCGHGGPWERPDLVNAVLVDFLTELSS